MIHGEEALELIKLLYPEIGDFQDNKFVSIGDVIISTNSISYVDISISFTEPMMILLWREF